MSTQNHLCMIYSCIDMVRIEDLFRHRNVERCIHNFHFWIPLWEGMLDIKWDGCKLRMYNGKKRMLDYFHRRKKLACNHTLNSGYLILYSLWNYKFGK